MAKEFKVTVGEHPEFVIDHDKQRLTVNGQDFPWYVAEGGAWVENADSEEKGTVLHLVLIEGTFTEIGKRDG